MPSFRFGQPGLPNHTRRRITCVLYGFLCLFGGMTALMAAPGPGTTQATYLPSEIETPTFTFPASVIGIDPTHAAFQHGYLIIAGQGENTPSFGGGVSWWNMSDPRAPTLVEKVTYRSRKPHALGFWENYAVFDRAYSGPAVWDVVDRQKVSDMPNTVQRSLTVFVQAPYVYKGSSGYSAPVSRISIWDVSDELAPVIAREFDTSFLGFKPDSVNVMGNLLLCAGAEGSGAAVFDVSDPINPVLLSQMIPADGAKSYQGQIYGNRYYIASDTGVRVYDFSDPLNLTDAGTVSATGRVLYLALKDGIGYSPGFLGSYAEFDADTLAILHENGTLEKDSVTPIGNVFFMGGDTQDGILVPIEENPDTLGPVVVASSPADGASSVPLTSRIGFSMSDHIDVTSLDALTLTVQPVAGGAIAGTYSTQMGIVNFSPDVPLQANTTYQVILSAGGIKDVVGNGLEEAFAMSFSTGNTVTNAPTILSLVSDSPTAEAGTSVLLTLTATDPAMEALEYSWDFGDGNTTGYSASPAASHTYAAPGRYTVIGRVQNESAAIVSKTFVQIVHHPLSNPRPAATSQIIHDAERNKVWNVNPDNDTVSRVDPVLFSMDFEIPVGSKPRGIALGPSGNEVWVACEGDDTIHVLDAQTGAAITTLELDYGSGPISVVFAPDGNAAYVALTGAGSLARFDPVSRLNTGTLALGPGPRAIAVAGDSSRILVSRFISPAGEGQVWDVDAAGLTLTGVIPLQNDPGPDSQNSGRGIPNYLLQMTISPDGQRLWIPSKKDNTDRGTFLDGNPLTHENTVRSIVSQIDLTGNSEDLAARKDVDNHGLPHGIAFSPVGDLVFVAYQDNNDVVVIDSQSGNTLAGVEITGELSPQGIVLSPDGSRLFVHNFMSRTISVYDVSALISATGSEIVLLQHISVVSSEQLSPQVLLGKQVFYNGADRRMNFEGYLSCATCHLDGGHDGRVWDFTDRGEGFRNTVSLRGKGGMLHGRVHWSGNFDEIQDFEGDIRNGFGGTGFIDDALFTAGTRSQPLGDAKAGLSVELDALTAYVNSLQTVPASPHRDSLGLMTPSAIDGRGHFQALNCVSCHSGDAFTDSTLGIPHDIGTLKPSSGNRLGQPLTGIDTPTLRGLWATAPYLHDGSATTLADVFLQANAPDGTPHAAMRTLTTQQQAELIDYLRQLNHEQCLQILADYPAESGVVGGGAALASANPGYNGTGYADFPPAGGWLEWTAIDGGAGGLATIRVRYNLDIGSDTPALNFTGVPFASHEGDVSGTVMLSDGGSTVTVSGNAWKQTNFPYDVTPNTTIRFTMSSTDQGELIGIGLDENQFLSDGPRVLSLGGNQVLGFENGFPITPLYNGGGPRFYDEAFGSLHTGATNFLVFMCDDDFDASANVTFSNIKVYEANVPRTVELSVNGVTQSLTFLPTEDSSDWQFAEAAVTLAPGMSNTIRITSTGVDAGHVDEIAVLGTCDGIDPGTPAQVQTDSLPGDEIALSWDALPEAESYIIEFREFPPGSPGIQLYPDGDTLALYRFNGSYADASGNGFNLNSAGNVTLASDNLEWMTQPIGQSARFGAIGDSLTVPIPDAAVMPSGGSPLTVEAWIYPRAYLNRGASELPMIALEQSSDSRLGLVDSSPVPAQDLDVWLRADAGLIEGGGGTIFQWNDQSGNGRHATAQNGGPSSEPVLDPDAANGRPALHFDGIDDFMTFGFDPNGLSGMTMVIVSAQDVNQDPLWSGVNHSPLFWSEVSYWSTLHLTPFQSQVRWSFGTGQAENLPEYTRPSSIGQGFTMTVAVKDGTNEHLYVDGVNVHSEGGKLPAIGGVQPTGNLGRGWDNTFFDGQIAEVLVYSKALSAAERTQVEDYLTKKYFGGSGVPTQDLGLWLRADAGVVESGGTVSEWQDQSGNGRHASALNGGPSGEPLLEADAVNGQPALHFDGIDDFMTFAFDPNGLSGMTMVLVSAQDVDQDPTFAGVNHSPLFWSEVSYWSTLHLTPFQSQVRWSFGTGQAENLPEYTRPSSVGQGFTTTIAVKDGTNERLYVDGINVHSEGGKLPVIGGVQTTGNLGRGWSNTFFDGRIAEVLVYAKALSDTERNQVESYLANRYVGGFIETPSGPSVSAGTSTFVSTQEWADNVSLNQWHLLQMSYDGTNTVQTWVDGNLLGSATYQPNLPETNPWSLTLGNFDGDVDELRLSSVARPIVPVPGPFSQLTVVPAGTNILELAGLNSDSAYTFRIRSRNAHGDSAWSEVALFNPNEVASFDDWKTARGIPLSTPHDDDSDDDGAVLFMEYALDLDPNLHDGNWEPVSTVAGTNAEVRYPRVRGELTYEVKHSTDLTNWTATGVDQGSGNIGEEIIATVPLSFEEPRTFIRLEVSGPF